MPLTAPAKTWEFDPNKTVGLASESLTNANQIFQMVTSMVNGVIFTSPWVVKGSSDSVAGAMDGVNRWVTAANVVASNTLGAPHSWIVLEQSAITFSGAANPLQVLVTMNGGNFANPLIWRTYVISPRAGFTGGGASTDPVATDQWAPYWRNAWFNGGAFSTSVQTVAMTSDGAITRIIIGRGTNVPLRWLSFETPRNPHPDWETPFVFMSKGTSDFTPVSGWVNSVLDLGGQNVGVRILNKSGAPVGEEDDAGFAKHGTCRLANWVANGRNMTRMLEANIPHEITGEYNTSPAHVFSNSPGNEGIWGELEDFYFIGDTTGIGDAIPSTGEKRWWVLGDMVTPGLNDSLTDIVL